MLWPQTICEFEAVVEAYQHELVRYAYHRLGNLQDAEDVVQEVFVRAYRDRDKRKDIAGVAPYLYRMVRNLSTDMIRRRREEPLREIASGEESATGPAESAARARRIAELLAKLPEREGEVIRLRVFADLPFHAIAKVIGRPLATVKSRFRYGIQKLRKTLDKGGRAI
jgi:RNA polymerase sigma-70 factor (ECF subfamily)